MENLKEVWVIGGDRRYAYAATYMKEQGVTVKTYGVPGMTDAARSLKEALSGVKTMLLPLFPVVGEMLVVNSETFPAALLPMVMARGGTVVAGSLPEELVAWYRDQGIHCENYIEQEAYQIANAAVTAEGAVSVAMNHLERTVSGAEVLVIGYGRIGKFLSEKLKALGANVTVAARRREHQAKISARGMTAATTGHYEAGLCKYDVIFNTVPGAVVTEEQLEYIKKDCLLIELASGDGGFPHGSPVIYAQGLPGKTAPKTAGEILGQTVLESLTLEGGVME